VPLILGHGIDEIGIYFFVLVILTVIVSSIVTSKCRCPQCNVVIKRDKTFRPEWLLPLHVPLVPDSLAVGTQSGRRGGLIPCKVVVFGPERFRQLFPTAKLSRGRSERWRYPRLTEYFPKLTNGMIF
jgi:hypothetical protein